MRDTDIYMAPCEKNKIRRSIYLRDTDIDMAPCELRSYDSRMVLALSRNRSMLDTRHASRFLAAFFQFLRGSRRNLQVCRRNLEVCRRNRRRFLGTTFSSWRRPRPMVAGDGYMALYQRVGAVWANQAEG